MKSLLHADHKAEILERLQHIHPESPRRWGKMTPHQMICHLSDAFRLALGERSARSVQTILNTSIVKWVALYVPVPWPKSYPTMPEMDQMIGGTAPIAFARDMETLRTLIERFCAGERDAAHPIFGPMTHKQWMRWGYLHMDHHLRQFRA